MKILNYYLITVPSTIQTLNRIFALLLTICFLTIACCMNQNFCTKVSSGAWSPKPYPASFYHAKTGWKLAKPFLAAVFIQNL